MTTPDTQKLITTPINGLGQQYPLSAYKLGANGGSDALRVAILDIGTPQEAWVAFFHVPRNPTIRCKKTEAEIQRRITEFQTQNVEVPQCLSDALKQIQATREELIRKGPSPHAPAPRR